MLVMCAVLYNNLASALIHKDSSGSSTEKALLRALELSPEWVIPREALSTLLIQQGKLDNARDHWRLVLLQSPSHASFEQMVDKHSKSAPAAPAEASGTVLDRLGKLEAQMAAVQQQLEKVLRKLEGSTA